MLTDAEKKKSFRDDIEQNWRLIIHDDQVNDIEEVPEMITEVIHRSGASINVANETFDVLHFNFCSFVTHPLNSTHSPKFRRAVRCASDSVRTT